MEIISKFAVRSCKFRGLLIESIEGQDGDVYFFKHQDQPIDKHCIQMQNILKAANIKRARKIQVDISGFINDYSNPGNNTMWFKGIKLESANQQIRKTLTKRINIDLGMIKRAETIKEQKAAKEAEKKKKLLEKQASIEKSFQEERARRIHELMEERKKQAERMDV